MHRRESYGPSADGAGDIPELPIPRPNEISRKGSEPRERERPIAAPSLGASFTAASEGEAAPTRVPPRDDLDETPPHDLQLLTWELAARLTSGMLANPSRSHASVKDAMGLFDQFLHEMHAYVRISSDLDVDLGEQRRRSHVEYFRAHEDEQQAGGSTTKHPNEQASSARPPTPAPAKPAPAKPRPAGDYRPIPPGMRGPYTAGGMAGTPPPPESDGDASTRAA